MPMEALPDGTAMVIHGRYGTHRSMPDRTVVDRFNLEWLTGDRVSLRGGPLRA